MKHIDINWILGISFSIYILLSIIELIGLYRYNLRFYNNGFKIFEKNLKFKFSNWKGLDGDYSEKEGKYIFIPEFKVGYLITKFNYFRVYSPIAFSSGLPLTIFGKFTEKNNEINVSFYISYRIAFLIALWFLAIILISLFAWNLMALGIGIFGIVFSLFLLYIAKLFYQGKMLTMTDELSKILKIRK